jgi:hypothetical protein
MRLKSTGSGETKDHGGRVRLRVELLEVDRSGFEKTNSQNFKRGTDLGLKTVGEG